MPVSPKSIHLEYNPIQAKKRIGTGMTTKRDLENLSEEALRALLLKKQRAARRARLAHYRKTGRASLIAPKPQSKQPGTIYTLPEKSHTRQRGLGKKILDAGLLLVEVAAVIGLVVIVLTGLNQLRQLNVEAENAFILPTLTPTPLISAVVLPSGHTPPNAGSSVRFNEAEIPAHLQPIYQDLGEILIPTPGPEQAVRLQIPAIGVDHPIVQGDGWEQLKKGIGQHISSANPGEPGNLVLSAHNDIFGEIFRDLDKLSPGDEIIVFSLQRQYVYTVQDTLIVEPTRVDLLEPTTAPTITLISCYPYMVDNQRIIVLGELADQ
jgi:sortase A